jgi:peptidoglycan hydrolase CwlO-like protein
MKRIIFLLVIFLPLLTFLLKDSLDFGLTGIVHAQSDSQRMEKLKQEIERYEKEVQRLNQEAGTLSGQIAQFDAQIGLTSLKIREIEEKISLLGGRIEQLESSVSSLVNAFNERAVQTYVMNRLGGPFLTILSSNDLSQMVSSYHYLKKIQEADRDLLGRLETAQNTYKTEKENQENLHKSLEDQKNVLGSQKTAKAQLLAVTKNDERKFQSLLSSSRSEFEAIQAIIAGRGAEEEVGKVSQGVRIASIINGPSCNSSGRHLHFIVSENGQARNPFNYLKPTDHNNCSGSSCGSGDGDPFNPSGNWDWPISPTIRYTQGYGSTWAVRNTWVGNIYQFHNGIDIDSPSTEIRSVKSGNLFRGSYTGSNGCRLRYVRVAHDDSSISTFYLHINY